MDVLNQYEICDLSSSAEDHRIQLRQDKFKNVNFLSKVYEKFLVEHVKQGFYRNF